MTIKSLLKSLLATTNQLKAKYLPRSNGDEFEQWMKEFEDKDRAEAQSKWIHQHRHEIRRGSQIVQREMHISAQLTYYQNLAEELNKLEPVDFELLAHCDTELKKMNQEHWKHRECLARLEGAKPPGRLVQEYCKNQQKHQHQKAQTLWKAERVYCQLRGGCCARDCGCCERSLRTIRDHSGRAWYMHCGKACSCCGCYRGESPESSQHSSC